MLATAWEDARLSRTDVAVPKTGDEAVFDVLAKKVEKETRTHFRGSYSKLQLRFFELVKASPERLEPTHIRSLREQQHRRRLSQDGDATGSNASCSDATGAAPIATKQVCRLVHGVYFNARGMRE